MSRDSEYGTSSERVAGPLEAGQLSCCLSCCDFRGGGAGARPKEKSNDCDLRVASTTTPLSSSVKSRSMRLRRGGGFGASPGGEPFSRLRASFDSCEISVSERPVVAA